MSRERDEKRIKRINAHRINQLYAMMNRVLPMGAKSAKIVTHGDTRLTLRAWKNGRGELLYDGDSMTLSDALDLMEVAVEGGWAVVNPEVFEGAYEY